MPAAKQLPVVYPQPGRPLYQTVKDAICSAIDAGVFAPGEQMPNTKLLSEQLGVSLVTTHRAMQEMMLSGVLERSQGRGTFVHSRFAERRKIAATLRVGLVFHPEASLADFYHGQIFDGVHKAAEAVGSDLILLRFGEDIRNECNACLFVNPFSDDLEKLRQDLPRGVPALVVGAQSCNGAIPSFDVDNHQIARQAVQHLAELGHRRIGYVGGAYKVTSSRDRWDGFIAACRELGIECHERHAIKAAGWQLGDGDLEALGAMLSRADRPTALFAADYSFALDVYGTAAAVGLRLPADLSVVSVDDPLGAGQLSPSLTTIRQPLAALGREAIRALADHLQNGAPLVGRRFTTELVVRESSRVNNPHVLRASAG